MAWSFDPTNVLRDWRYGEDAQRAAFEARGLINDIVRLDESMAKKLAKASAAAEVLFDGPGRNPQLVRQTMDLLAKRWRYLESAFPVSLEERTRHRVAIEVLRSRAWHCDGDSRRALEYCIAAHTQIETLAGGREALFRRLSGGDPDLASELLVSILGIFAAALKRSLPRGSKARAYWVGEIRALALSYLTGLKIPPTNVYPGAPSMVQVLYMLCEEGRAEDADLIAALREFDVRVRPDDDRARATVPLREIAIARFRGDLAAATLLAPSAERDLKVKGLERHLTVVRDEHYTR